MCVCIVAIVILLANRIFSAPYCIVISVPFGSDLSKLFHKNQNVFETIFWI